MLLSNEDDDDLDNNENNNNDNLEDKEAIDKYNSQICPHSENYINWKVKYDTRAFF